VALLALLFGGSVGHADPFSLSQTNLAQAPRLTAWETNSSDRRLTVENVSELNDSKPKWRIAYLPNDPAIPWIPLKEPLVNNDSAGDFISDLSFQNVSARSDISDEDLEIQFEPIRDNPPGSNLSWSRPQEVVEPMVQFSESPSDGTSPVIPASQPKASGDSIDYSGQDTARASSRAKFSAADLGGTRSDPARDPGILTEALDGLPPSSSEPIPQIASPEPTVTALWGISVLLFAYRTKVRGKL
jgi:hypothetical protein